MERECQCPRCKQLINKVFCYNCGEEIEIFEIMES